MERVYNEFAKVEVRLPSDQRFIGLSEFEQLLFFHLLLLSKQTNNKMTKDLNVIRKYMNSDRSLTDFESAVNRIKKSFPKFKQNKYFYYFEDYAKRYRNVVKFNKICATREKSEERRVKSKRNSKRKVKLTPTEQFAATRAQKRQDKVELIVMDFNDICRPARPYTMKTIGSRNLAALKARLKEGFTPGDFKYVHRVKVQEWEKDEKMSKFLRPSTLWGSKFADYRAQRFKDEPERKEIDVFKYNEEKARQQRDTGEAAAETDSLSERGLPDWLATETDTTEGGTATLRTVGSEADESVGNKDKPAAG